MCSPIFLVPMVTSVRRYIPVRIDMTSVTVERLENHITNETSEVRFSVTSA